nr:MAG TPA: hypothetical protein [Siphoviridae sp. ctX8T1]
MFWVKIFMMFIMEWLGQAALRWVAVRCFAALGFATGL